MLTRFERFSTAISEIDRYWHKIASDEMEKYGLKGPYAVYILAILNNKGITAAKLSEITDRNKADVSRAINDLSKKQIVIKEGNSYRALISLTNKGEEIANQVKLKTAKAVELGGKGLSEQDREIFYNSIELIAKNLKEIAREGL